MIQIYSFQLTLMLTGNQLLYQGSPEINIFGFKASLYLRLYKYILMKYLYTLTQLRGRNRSNG